MASNQTEHYGLNQWSAEDSFLRTEFNEDNRKVDQALVGKCEFLLGTYTGNADNTTGEQVVQIGFTPRAVLISNSSAQFLTASYVDGGFAVGPGVVDESGASGEYLKIVPGGFQVKNGPTSYINRPSRHYYMALK